MRDLPLRNPRMPLPHIDKKPLSISVERAGEKESEHLVDLAVVDIDGNVVLGFGDLERQVFPRSAMKPLQSIALAELLNQHPEYGQLTPAEYALITASHNAEDIHVDAVHYLLSRFGIDPEHLICGRIGHWIRPLVFRKHDQWKRRLRLIITAQANTLECLCLRI